MLGREMKRCCGCRVIKPREEFHKRNRFRNGLQSLCKACMHESYLRLRDDPNFRERMGRNRKAWLEKNPERWAEVKKAYLARNPQKVLAKRRVNSAIASGKLQRHPCSVCGCAPAHAHHPDYSQPLNVVWLCPLHHGEIHRKDYESA
jgi:hypothetical protein